MAVGESERQLIRKRLQHSVLLRPRSRNAKYCDERVCLRVCLSVRDHIYTPDLHQVYVSGEKVRIFDFIRIEKCQKIAI